MRGVNKLKAIDAYVSRSILLLLLVLPTVLTHQAYAGEIPYQSSSSAMGVWDAYDSQGSMDEIRPVKRSEKRLGVRRSVDIGARFSIPEGYGLDLNWRFHSYFSINAYASRPLDLQINYAIKSRTIVERRGYALRQPSLRLPIKAGFGPSVGMGLSVHPLRGGFFISGGIQHRIVTLESQAQSPVEIVDSNSQTFSNSRLFASAKTETRQILGQVALGHRYGILDHSLFFSWSVGVNRPFFSKSQQSVDLEVINPRASRQDEVVADNFDDVELQEEIKAEGGLSDLLRDIEKASIPFISMSFGWRW